MADGDGALFAKLLDGFTSLVGVDVSQETFHLASLHEGRRLGQSEPTLEAAVARVDSILGQRTAFALDGHRASATVDGSTLLADGQRVQHSIVLGLFEGVLEAKTGRRFKGRIVQCGAAGARLEFEAAG